MNDINTKISIFNEWLERGGVKKPKELQIKNVGESGFGLIYNDEKNNKINHNDHHNKLNSPHVNHYLLFILNILSLYFIIIFRINIFLLYFSK